MTVPAWEPAKSQGIQVPGACGHESSLRRLAHGTALGALGWADPALRGADMGTGAPFRTAKSSRRQRRAAAQRSEARRRALEAAAIADIGTSQGPPGRKSLLQAAAVAMAQPAVTDRVQPGPRWLARFSAMALGALVTLFVTLFEGLPIDGRSLDWPWAVGGIVATLATLFYAARYAVAAKSRRGVGVVAGAWVVVVIMLFVGLGSTTVVNGSAYLNSSPTATVYRFSSRAGRDLATMSSFAQLVTDGTALARADYSAYTPAVSSLDAMSSYYAGLARRQGPAPLSQIASVAQVLSDASYWESKALAAKANDIVQPDTKNEANIASWEQAAAGYISTAQSDLSTLSAAYNISTTSPGAP